MDQKAKPIIDELVKRDYSYADIASALDVSEQTVRGWYRGTKCSHSLVFQALENLLRKEMEDGQS